MGSCLLVGLAKRPFSPHPILFSCIWERGLVQLVVRENGTHANGRSPTLYPYLKRKYGPA